MNKVINRRKKLPSIDQVVPMENDNSPRQQSLNISILKPNCLQLKNVLLNDILSKDKDTQNTSKSMNLSIHRQEQKRKKNKLVLNGKKHVTFKTNISQVIIVENWKIYNVYTEEDENICPCILI